MLHERFAVILVLVILVINCSPIQQTVDKVSEDGHLYNPNPTEKGPISEKIFEIRPQLAFLGQFNNHYWYIERTAVSYSSAVTGCENIGMTIAKTNQAELNFIYDSTSSSDDYSWLGGSVYMSPYSFQWRVDGSVPIGFPFRYSEYNTLGLVLDRWSGNSGVYVEPSNNNHYYICYLLY